MHRKNLASAIACAAVVGLVACGGGTPDGHDEGEAVEATSSQSSAVIVRKGATSERVSIGGLAAHVVQATPEPVASKEHVVFRPRKFCPAVYPGCTVSDAFASTGAEQALEALGCGAPMTLDLEPSYPYGSAFMDCPDNAEVRALVSELARSGTLKKVRISSRDPSSPQYACAACLAEAREGRMYIFYDDPRNPHPTCVGGCMWDWTLPSWMTAPDHSTTVVVGIPRWP
jgi:hypothetical protein